MSEPWKWGEDKQPQDAYDTAPAGTRFLMCGYDAHAREFASGDWVRHSDYARLQAEVKRLEYESAKWRRAEYAVGDKCIEFAKTIQTLKAEVERLRKAGDGLGWAVHRLKERFWDADEEANKAIHDWNAAKDGKPTE
jgi:uncharacterized protein YukE